MLALLAEGTQVAGVYTRSLTAAAPVEWCRQAGNKARALVVNAGNANAFTGRKGREAVDAVLDRTASLVGCDRREVYVASTGVIGELLPYENITAALDGLQNGASADGWAEAAEAIMTTDTFPKLATRTATIGDREVTINGIAKGSGMIAPDMATMLAFIFTDAAIDVRTLKALLVRHTRHSFNSITVDSDTSTSDMALLFATGKAGNAAPESPGDPALDMFNMALADLMDDLARQIVCDGEGASKLITIDVTGAEDNGAARRIGLSIGNSPLVKTAVAGEDPNWGRIIAAVGKCGEWVDRDQLTIFIGDEKVTENGMIRDGYSEPNAAAHMKGKEVHIAVDVGVGTGEARVWSCDLTDGYIRINADYRS